MATPYAADLRKERKRIRRRIAPGRSKMEPKEYKKRSKCCQNGVKTKTVKKITKMKGKGSTPWHDLGIICVQNQTKYNQPIINKSMPKTNGQCMPKVSLGRGQSKTTADLPVQRRSVRLIAGSDILLRGQLL